MEGFVELRIRCRICDKLHRIKVNKSRYLDYLNGEGLIQDLLPELTPAERELIISQTCNDCWQDIFADVYGYEEEEYE